MFLYEKKWIFNILLLSLVFLSLEVNANDDPFVRFFNSEYYKSVHFNSDSILLKDFPFTEYVEKVPIDSIHLINKHSSLIEKNGNDAKLFLIKVLEFSIQKKSYDYSRMDEYLRLVNLAERYTIYGEEVNSPNSNFVGFWIFSFITQKLNRGLEEEKINVKDHTFKSIRSNLEKYQFYTVSLPKSDFQKLLFHVEKRNWKHIKRRILGRYQYESILLFSLIFSFLFFLGKRIVKSKAKNKL